MIVLYIILAIVVLTGCFCLWVLAKASGIATNKEEQMEIERKLRNNGKR